ncbi:hypothetical protein XA68_12350 [Ophiocordyceps unilateralis]|uniref:Cyanovirin-N domain-containing protein n=1 Tax=Ophiocordyceps unilateralis TaxID=268505 RepID=A0A2A9PVU8_OPHUN|nr:hypothetical protein XA68_12350 [Ophiocordyceps unilateralis]
MKFFATLTMAAGVALAMEHVQDTAMAGSKGGYGPVSKDVKKLGREVAKFQGCFMKRLWQDAQQFDCGDCKSQSNQTLTACICKNQDKLSHKIRTSTNICMNKQSDSSGIIREINSNPDGLGISALCGAYEDGEDGKDGGGGKLY